jgi:hypothetical protein
MINMDMLGRLNTAAPTITIGGYGTSPAWGAAYAVKINGVRFILKEVEVMFFHPPTSGKVRVSRPGGMS